GEVRWKGHLITGTPAFRRARLGLVRTFQQPRTFPALTVRQNLLIAAESRTRTPAGRSPHDVATMFGLEEVLDQPASALSYGFAKRLGVALAVATGAELVMLDEPAAG